MKHWFAAPSYAASTPLEWVEFVSPVDNRWDSEKALQLISLEPLAQGAAWFDFGSIDQNSKFTIMVWALVDAQTRKVSRADIEFGKPEPGWPPAVIVNGIPQRMDGILDYSFALYPFERTVTIIQTQGKPAVLRYALLTGVTQTASVSA